MFHPRKEIPFCSIKSPRRNTRFHEFNLLSDSISLEYFHRNFDLYDAMEKQYCLRSVHLSPVNDYLHPKYSLPPVKMNIADSQDNSLDCRFSKNAVKTGRRQNLKVW
ncbi:unnamed protein product [Dracunculus medinensis]|uniref:Ovule protein n=1 Tax=Dracunculus medinensis TaxID=318479 RepID=A0A0N4U0Y1_DRAME|nr:unnamed protein product [Dracunculus medinensis]